MLAPEEFTVGSFSSAPVGSLILPRTEYEAIVLVGVLQDAETAVFLSESHQFECFGTKESENWSGLIIPNVSIEVDETTAFDATHGFAPLGALVRTADHFSIVAMPDRMRGRRFQVNLRRGLPSIGSEAVGFSKWQVVLGTGENKRVLHKVQVAERS